MMLLLAVLLFSCDLAAAQIGCVRHDNRTFSCNFTAPYSTAFVPYTDFSGEFPQTLNFTHVNGALGTVPLFTNFPQFNPVSYINNYFLKIPLLFSINCAGNPLTLTSGFFDGLTTHNDTYIIDCNISSLPAGVFNKTNMTSLTITGGSLYNIDPLALSGMMLVDDDYSGNIVFDNVFVNDTVYPDGFFRQVQNLQSLSLKNNNLRYFTRPVIEGCTNLKYLYLNGNNIDVFSEGIFDNIKGLWYIDLSGLPLDCSTCTHNVWLFDWADAYRIQLVGELLCTHPLEKRGMRMYTYNTTVCAAKPTIDPLEVVIGMFLFISLALSMAAFGMVMLLKSSINGRKRMVHSHIKYLKHWKPIHDDLDPIEEPKIDLSGGKSGEAKPEGDENPSPGSRPTTADNLRKRPGTAGSRPASGARTSPAAAAGSGESRPTSGGVQCVGHMTNETEGNNPEGERNSPAPVQT